MAPIDANSKMLTPPDTPETTTNAAQPPPTPTPQTDTPTGQTSQPSSQHIAEPPSPDDSPSPQPKEGHETNDGVRQHARHTAHTSTRLWKAHRPVDRSLTDAPTTPAKSPASTTSSSTTTSLRRSKTQSHRRRVAPARDPSKRASMLAPDHFDTSPATYRYAVDADVDASYGPGPAAGQHSWDIVPTRAPAYDADTEDEGYALMPYRGAPPPATQKTLSPQGWGGGSGARQTGVARRKSGSSRALRVKLNLNLEIEITLKARIQGEVLLTVL
jgi:hypothetical protein